MKIKYLSIILIIVSLFLTSCGEKSPAVTTGQAFIGGTDGLVVEFEQISIKDGDVYSAFDDEDFSLEVTINNKGEQDIDRGDVTLELLGPAKEDFSGISSWEKQNSDDLEKISEFNPIGGEETITFADRAQYKKEVTGAIDFTWNVNYKYNYKTHLIVDDVCFKEDLQDDRVCEVEESKTFSVSSAPITVLSVKEENAGKGIVALTIELSNAGGGDTTLVGQDFDLRYDQFSFEIEEANKWECKAGAKENEGRFDPTTNTATIRCKLKEALDEGELYTSPVRLTIEYVYQDLIKETLRIKESGE